MDVKKFYFYLIKENNRPATFSTCLNALLMDPLSILIKVVIKGVHLIKMHPFYFKSFYFKL